MARGLSAASRHALNFGEDRCELIHIIKITLCKDLGEGLPAFRHLPHVDALDTGMLDQVIEIPADIFANNCPDLVGVFSLTRPAAMLDNASFCMAAGLFVGAPNDGCVQAQLIVKVLKDQAFVVARYFGNGIDARPVKAMFGKDFFSSIQNRFAGTFCIVHSSSTLTSRLIHRILSNNLTSWIYNQLVRL